MTMSISQVNASQLGEAFNAAQRLLTLRDYVLEHADAVNTKLSTLDDTWTGDAANACRARWSEMSTEFQQVADGLTNAHRSVQTNAQGFVDLRNALTNALYSYTGVAGDGMYLIADDGTATEGPKAEAVETQGGGTVDTAAVTRDIQGRLADLADARTLLAGSLGLSLATSQAEQASPGWMDQNSASLLTVLAVDIPEPGTDPAEVVWWSTLSPDVQQQMIDHKFDWLGALGTGLPATVREAANFNRLTRDQAQFTAELATLDPSNVADRVKIQPLQAALDNVNGILDALRKARAAYPDVMVGVLNYVASGLPNDGGVAIAIGNPDDATNLSIYQPGTSHGTASPDIDRGITLYGAMQSVSPGGNAVIVNISGPEPRNVQPDLSDPVPQASRDVYANQVAQQTATDMNGFQFLNPNAHVTVVAHSYATYVVGLASSEYGLHANDIVLVGSPGAGVGDASDLGGATVWSGQAPSDPINTVPGRFTPDPWSPLNVGQDNPSDPSWGANRFDVGDGDHGSYFVPGSPGMTNISDIATGRYSSVTPATVPGVPPVTGWAQRIPYGPLQQVFG